MSRYSPRARLTNTVSTAAIANWFGNQFVILPSSYDSISTGTGNGSASSFTFTVPSGYRHLQLRMFLRGVRSFTLEQVYVRLNGDSGNNYSYHWAYGIGSGSGGSFAGTTTNVYLAHQMPGGLETSNIFSPLIVDIFNVSGTNNYKTMRGLFGYDNNGNTSNYSGDSGISSGLWMNTAAVTSVTVLSNGAFATGTSVALYGIKDTI